MSRFRCADCGIVLSSSSEVSEHRRRTHPDPSDLSEMSLELSDQWAMIQACAHDQQWLFLSLALDQHIKHLQRWRKATERMLLG